MSINSFSKVFILSLVLIGCSKDDEINFNSITNEFQIALINKANIVFKNSECEFDNRSTQSQWNVDLVSSNGIRNGYDLWSSYSNLDENEEFKERIQISFIVEYYGEQTRYNIDSLTNLLSKEVSSKINCHIYPRIHLNICDSSYNNLQVERDTSLSIFTLDSNFEFIINDHQILYESECNNRELLYIDMTIDGSLYNHKDGIINDSIQLEESRIRLLFDMSES